MKVFSLLFALLLLIVCSCEDPTDVGAGIIPPSDALAVDSISFFDITVNNFRDDSILNSSISQVQLGRYDDETFGSGIASYYTEIFFNGFFNRLDDAVLDSLVLYLNVTGFQGDSLVPQTINIFEMADTLRSNIGDDGEFYYLFETVPKGDLITEFSNVVFTSNQTRVDTTLTSFHLKTQMPEEFSNNLFEQLNDSTITNSNEFQSYLNGLVFEPDVNAGGDGWFQIGTNTRLPELTGLYFYSHNDTDTVKNVITFPTTTDAIINGVYSSGAQNLNFLLNDYDDADMALLNQIDNPNPNGNEFGYLQGGNGTYAELNFDQLFDDFDGDNPQVNLAQLIIKPQLASLDDTLSLPVTLFLAEEFFRNDDGEKIGPVFGIDGSGRANTVDLSRFDQTATAFRVRVDEGEYEYRFTLPKTIQAMIDGELEPTLYMFVNTRSQSMNGLKFESSNTELEIYYTKIE